MDNCTGWVVEVLDADKLWAIICGSCRQCYTIEHKENNGEQNEG